MTVNGRPSTLIVAPVRSLRAAAAAEPATSSWPFRGGRPSTLHHFLRSNSFFGCTPMSRPCRPPTLTAPRSSGAMIAMFLRLAIVAMRARSDCRMSRAPVVTAPTVTPP